SSFRQPPGGRSPAGRAADRATRRGYPAPENRTKPMPTSFSGNFNTRAIAFRWRFLPAKTVSWSTPHAPPRLVRSRRACRSALGGYSGAHKMSRPGRETHVRFPQARPSQILHSRLRAEGCLTTGLRARGEPPSVKESDSREEVVSIVRPRSARGHGTSRTGERAERRPCHRERNGRPRLRATGYEDEPAPRGQRRVGSERDR